MTTPTMWMDASELVLALARRLDSTRWAISGLTARAARLCCAGLYRSEIEISPARAGRRKFGACIDRPLDRRLMSASPRKTTQWLFICGTPPKTSAHTPQSEPTHRCTVTVRCSGALCFVLCACAAHCARAPCLCLRGCSARTLCPDPPLCALFLVQVRFARRRNRLEAARGPRRGWPGRVRVLFLALYGLQVFLLLWWP